MHLMSVIHAVFFVMEWIKKNLYKTCSFYKNQTSPLWKGHGRLDAWPYSTA